MQAEAAGRTALRHRIFIAQTTTTNHKLHAKPRTRNAAAGVTAAGTAGGAAADTASAAAVVASAGAAAAAGAGAAGTAATGAVSDAVSDAVSADDDTGAAGVAGASASAAIAFAAATVKATSRDGARACCELQPLMWVSYTLAFQAFRRRYKFKPPKGKWPGGSDNLADIGGI